jgi:hypothetical protein
MSRLLLYQPVIQSFGTNNANGTVALLSPVIEVWPYYFLSAEAKWTGTPSGTFSWEASNQYHPITNPNATFVPIDSSFVQFIGRIGGSTSPSGSAGSSFASVNLFGSQTIAALGTRWLRLRYTNASGAGPLDVWFSAEGYD